MRQTRMLFVTGASRSGTTMLSRILGNHSKILGLNELHYFGDLCDPAAGSKAAVTDELERLAAVLFARQARGIWDSGCTDADHARAKQLCGNLDAAQRSPFGVYSAAVESLAEDAGKTIACEQTPRNVFYAGRLLEVFPELRVIHIVRDPRAVLASQKNRWRVRQLGAKHVPFAELVRIWLNYHPITMARLWADANRSALRLADHPRMKIVRFEALVADSRRTIGEICEFSGVEFEPAMLQVPQWGSSNIQYQPEVMGISQDVVDRWQQTLTRGEVGIAERFAGPLMARFSYENRSAKSAAAQVMLGRYLLSYPFHLIGVALVNPRRAWTQLRAVLRSGSDGRAHDDLAGIASKQ